MDLEEALKKYCELDTLAMAMIMEYFLLEMSKVCSHPSFHPIQSRRRSLSVVVDTGRRAAGSILGLPLN